MSLPDGVQATGDMLEVARTCSVILMVVPTPFVERTLQPLQQHLRSDQVRSAPLLHWRSAAAAACMSLPDCLYVASQQQSRPRRVQLL